MDIIAYINNLLYQYISIDNIVEYGSIILLLLVIWTFWGKEGVVRNLLGRWRK